jgi:signal peptidase I
MVPTLEENDKIIVDKLSLHFSELKRGDIVTFFPPEGLSGMSNTSRMRYIKRVIGLPGETIEVKKGQGVFINGKRLLEPYVLFYPERRSLPTYNYGPVTLPEGSFFLLGDNRHGSRDSHIWGSCPKENIIGRAMFRYWPLYRIGTIEDKSFRDHYFAEGGY